MPDPTTSPRRRRDRRGRGLRGPLLPEGTPAARSRAEQFDELVLEELARLSRRFRDELAQVDLVVADVPPDGADEVHLFRTSPATGDRPAQVVVHRRPVESRARGLRAREDLVRAVVVEAVAELLGLAPEDVDPDVGGDDDHP